MQKPKESVRRFDVFAEYSRQDAERDGMPAAEAKGYGIWLAKVVASKRNGRSSAPKTTTAQTGPHKQGSVASPDKRWRTLDGIPQTDDLFDKEIVQRVGRDFYEHVMVPAIRSAINSGDTYTSIRDKIRQDWKTS